MIPAGFFLTIQKMQFHFQTARKVTRFVVDLKRDAFSFFFFFSERLLVKRERPQLLAGGLDLTDGFGSRRNEPEQGDAFQLEDQKPEETDSLNDDRVVLTSVFRPTLKYSLSPRLARERSNIGPNDLLPEFDRRDLISPPDFSIFNLK
ncbi:MAG: hypothetical protein R2747_00030 [Pyrinomonadaceae bacterium]